MAARKKTDGPKRVRFSDFRDMRIAEAGIVVEMDNGEEFVIPPPDLWPDMDPTTRDEDLARLVMGDRADAFVAAGGSGRLIGSLIQQQAHLPLPESSASSES